MQGRATCRYEGLISSGVDPRPRLSNRILRTQTAAGEDLGLIRSYQVGGRLQPSRLRDKLRRQTGMKAISAGFKDSVAT
eukprot:scaffold284213_cov53-Prasinocladus_malaysianus.AAC.1